MSTRVIISYTLTVWREIFKFSKKMPSLPHFSQSLSVKIFLFLFQVINIQDEARLGLLLVLRPFKVRQEALYT